jgi:hypothetical protein
MALLLLASPATAIDADDIDFPTSASLPYEALEALRAMPGSEKLALRANLNPFFLQGDFNGDGRLDVAVLVAEKATGKHGIAVVHGPGDVHVLGAGVEVDDRGDDYDWLDAWHTYPKGAVDQGMGEEDDPPALLGDALLVMKTEAASALIYWTGDGYAWYQQGD